MIWIRSLDTLYIMNEPIPIPSMSRVNNLLISNCLTFQPVIIRVATRNQDFLKHLSLFRKRKFIEPKVPTLS